MDGIIPIYDNALRDKGTPNSKFHGKITNSLCLNLIRYIDKNHAKGNKVSCRKILNWLRKKHAVYRINHTLSQAIIDIDLYYKPSKNAQQ